MCGKISILQQSTGRVASSAEQYGAVQQEMRIATSVEIMLLHLENIKRSFEREHSELEETKRILVQHKLIESEGRKEIIPRNRSISVIQGSKYPDLPELRRASLSTGHSHNLHNSNNSLTVDSSSSNTRPKSPTLLQMVSVRSLATTVSDEFSRKLEKKTSIFRPIAEEENKNDSNNNSSKENKNRGLLDRRRDSRRQSQFDVDTIIEEIDELAVKRDSSPTPPSVGSATPLLNSPRPLVLPSSPAEILKRKKSLILHLQTWYSDLYWPYDEEETILGLRYFISGLLSVAAFAIVVATLIG
ncbi:lymphoid-restricted membrane protein [Eurytemora carolleeae]|uniref:lymphoid-restricted membrane protein n=1 Tax=Eurytemora carolleeae TaxID=1294199 RepID=UPI000C767F4D|nr:lymphoid-restricted membrane protein [Eurytemora carolleeae]|eukprot:XP_023326662.1 lymphoid-restricted membrane protein-like [Eurytemora affinis]